MATKTINRGDSCTIDVIIEDDLLSSVVDVWLSVRGDLVAQNTSEDIPFVNASANIFRCQLKSSYTQALKGLYPIIVVVQWNDLGVRKNFEQELYLEVKNNSNPANNDAVSDNPDIEIEVSKGDNGLIASVTLATIYRGYTGYAGWTPVIAQVPDGARLVNQITDYEGGGGTLPTILSDRVGKYQKSDGTWTSVIADAFDINTGSAANAAIATTKANEASSSATLAASYASLAVQNEAVLNDITEKKKSVSFAGSDYATIITAIANPNTRYTKTIDGSGNAVYTKLDTNLLLIGPLLNINTVVNKLFEAECIFSNSNASTGFCMAINPSSSTVMDAIGHIALTWRQSGAFLAYGADGSTPKTSSLTFSPANNQLPAITFADGDVLKMQLLYRDDSSEATWRCYKNGSLVVETVVGQLPTGYIGTTFRGTNTVSCTFTKLSSQYLNYTQRAYYISGTGNDTTGTGTEKYPFLTLSKAVSKSYESPGNLKLLMKPGVYRGSAIFDGSKYQNIEIIGQSGYETITRASLLVTSGWTKTSGRTNIYERSNTFNSGSSSVGIVDLSNTTVLPSAAVLSYKIYTRLSPNSSLATMDSTAASCMVDTTTGILYVNCVGGVSPNTLQLEVSNSNFGVAINRTIGASNYCNLRLQNLIVQYAYSHNISVKGAYIMAEACTAMGSNVSNGFGIDDSIGRLYGCIGEGNYNDGFNAAGGQNQDLSHAMWFFDCIGRKNVVGDGMSNHDGTWHIHGGEYSDNGKDGIIPTGQAVLHNVIAKRNTSGFQLYPAELNSRDSIANIFGGDFSENRQAGIHVEPGVSVSLKATINVYSSRIANNAKGLMAYNTTGNPARSVINAYNLKDGGGNTTLKSNSGGTINVYNDIPVT